MRILGIDLGDARTGIAMTDNFGKMASGFGVLKESGLKKTAAAVADLAVKYDITEIALGNPLNMDGTEGDRSEKAKAFAALLKGQLGARNIEAKITLVDERCTTIEANEILTKTGNSVKEKREKIDMVAAEIILRSYIEKKE